METEFGILVRRHSGGGFKLSTAEQDQSNLRVLTRMAEAFPDAAVADQKSTQAAIFALEALLTPVAKAANPDGCTSQPSTVEVCFCQMLAGGDTRTTLTDDQLHECLRMLLQLRGREASHPTTLRLLSRAGVIARSILKDPDLA